MTCTIFWLFAPDVLPQTLKNVMVELSDDT